MRTPILILPLLLFGAVSEAFAQRRVDLRNNYERLLAIVPLTGAGTWADPRRPLHAPVSIAGGVQRSGILAFTFLPSDDGQFALVEFVARDRSAFRQILADTRPGLKVFDKGRHPRAEIEAEFKKLRKDFDPSRFGVAVR